MKCCLLARPLSIKALYKYQVLLIHTKVAKILQFCCLPWDAGVRFWGRHGIIWKKQKKHISAINELSSSYLNSDGDKHNLFKER